MSPKKTLNIKHMHHTFKPAVIGGTGKSGQYLVKALAGKNIRFNMLVRNPEHLSIKYPQAEIVYGNVLDPEAISSLFEGCDVVISTLGLGIPASQPDLFSHATANLLQAMATHGIKRYIAVTGLNVDAPGDRKSDQTTAATAWMYANFPVSTADRQKEYDMLSASDLDWTLVRLPRILQTEDRSEVSVSLEDCPGEGISAANLAEFLIGQAEDRRFIQKAPFISDHLSVDSGQK